MYDQFGAEGLNGGTGFGGGPAFGEDIFHHFFGTGFGGTVFFFLDHFLK